MPFKYYHKQLSKHSTTKDINERRQRTLSAARVRSSAASYESQSIENEDKESGRREEWVGELQSMARHKRGLTHWRGGRGRSGLVNSKAWHVTNEDSLTGGEEEGGVGWGDLKYGKRKKRTNQLEGRKRRELSACV